MGQTSDERDLRDWLEQQPSKLQVLLATRSALRELPLLFENGLNQTALPSFRALIAASSVAYRSTSEGQKASRTAAIYYQRFADASSSQIFAAANAAAEVNPSNYASHATPIKGQIAAWHTYKLDATMPSEVLLYRPLWQNEDWPETRSPNKKFLAELKPPVWDFWNRWYSGALLGKPIAWETQHRIALISDDEWGKGAAHVASVIAQIEQDMQGDPLDQDNLRAHLARVAQAPTVHADAAEAIAEQLDAAIKRYCDEAPANGLPEGFEPFERVPRVFRAIASTLRQNDAKDARIEALQAHVNELYATIAQLQTELAETRGRLAERRLTAEEARNTRRLGAILRENIAVTATIGALVFTALPFFGMRAEDFPYQPLRDDFIGVADEMSEVQPAEELRDWSEKVGDDHAQLPADAPPDSAPQTSPRPESRPETSPRTSKRPEPRPKS